MADDSEDPAPNIKNIPPANLIFLSPKIKRLQELLDQHDKSGKLSKIVEGAEYALQDSKNPERFYQAAHSIREVSNLLNDEVKPEIAQHSEDLKETVRLIRKIERAKPKRLTAASLNIWSAVVQAAKKAAEPNQKQNMTATIAKKYFGKPALIKSVVGVRHKSVDAWQQHHEWFVKVCHHRKSFEEPEFLNKWNALQDILIKIFNAQFSPQSELIDVMISSGKPNASFRPVLKEILKTPPLAEYFFKNLSKPDWFESLREIGAFKSVPEPEVSEDGKLIRFPPWWQVVYITKVADQIPSKISKLLQQIKTKNQFVINGVMEVALRLPVNHAAKLLTLIDTWLDIPHHGLIHHRVMELFQKALSVKKYSVALRIFNLSARVTAGRDGKEALRFDPYTFNEMKSKLLSALIEAKPKAVLSIGERWLRKAIHFKRSKVKMDDSVYWRPAVESHEQNWDHDDVKDLLTDVVRDSLDALCRKESAEARRIIERYLRDKCSIFRRVAIHTLRLCDGNDDLVHLLLNDPDNLYSGKYIRHEFLFLVKTKLHLLPSQDQDNFFTRLLAGPPRETYQKASEEEFEKYRLYKIRDTLAPLTPILGHRPDLLQKLDELEKQLGKREYPDIESPHFSWTGPESPLNKTQISAMSVDEFLIFITEKFHPTTVGWEASPEGLSRIFEEVVQDNPEPYAEAASKFFDPSVIYPAYPTGLIRGLEKACQNRKTYPLKPVLTLCEALTSTLDDKDIDIHHQRRDEFSFGTFKWSRGGVCNLLGKILEWEGFPISVEEMARIKKIIFLIAEKDPSPNAMEERKPDSPEGVDFVSECINCTRGKAMHALVAYAFRWAKTFRPVEEIESEKGKGPFPPGASRFEGDVKAFLDRRLTEELSPSVQSTYGYFLPQLYYLDKDWVNKKRSEGLLFPQAADRQAFWVAHWEGFIGYTNLYAELFEMLRDDFRRAIDEFAEVGGLQKQHDRYGPRLAENLMLAYWHSHEKYETGSLVELFFNKATDSCRSRAIWCLGNFYKEIDSKSDQEKKWPLLKDLWERRKDAADSEAASFARWFEFIPESVEQMLHLIKPIIPSLRKGYQEEKLLDYLEKHVTASSKACMELLIELLKSSESVMNVSYRLESVRPILTQAKASGDPAAMDLVTNAVDRLGELGYYDFRDLLST